MMCCIGLHNPKFMSNVGAVSRACGCFGAKALIVSGARYLSKKNLREDTFKNFRRTPVIRVDDFKGYKEV